jgi:DNA-binding SARP family transcriptional activator
MILDFGVLGPLQMSVDGAPLPLGTPKQRAVLAMLVMGRNRPVSSDSLVNAAWEQFPPPEPKASLHSHVSNLRRPAGTCRARWPNGAARSSTTSATSSSSTPSRPR